MMVNFSSKGFSICKKSSCIILSFKTGYFCLRSGTFSSSSSTALKFIFPIFINSFVSAPPPGPTSNKFVNEFSRKASTIFFMIRSSFKKCCPSDFFNLYMPQKYNKKAPSFSGEEAFKIINLSFYTLIL